MKIKKLNELNKILILEREKEREGERGLNLKTRNTYIFKCTECSPQGLKHLWNFTSPVYP